MTNGKQSIARLIIQVILLCTLGALGIIIFYYFAAFRQSGGFQSNLISDLYYLLFFSAMTVLFLILPSFYFFLNLKLLRKSLRTSNIIPLNFTHKVKYLNKLLFSVILLFNIFLIGTTSYIAYDILTEKPPQFFPFNDPKSSYEIIRDHDGYYQLKYFNPTDSNKHWVCTREEGRREECEWEKWSEFTLYIGSSPVDLSEFVDKEVIVNGDFDYSKKQCIIDKCSSFFMNQSVAAVMIKSIKVK